jgi:hypothetical protein
MWGGVPPFIPPCFFVAWYSIKHTSFYLTFYIVYIYFKRWYKAVCYPSPQLRGGGGCSGSARWGLKPSMGMLHVCIPAPAFTTQMNPKEIHFTDFRRFNSGQQVMTFMQYTVLIVMVEHGKWKWSLQHYISLLGFKFTQGTLWSLILKFTIFPLCLWNMTNTS